ncbi:MAG: hypothetical protein IKE60_26365 [Reyranella sp.]|uniref:hypothetical protein n=1 Tax=Reyranella sp. TaxID=1929291 RepID=UPI0025E5F970|nr:hypothetical protein [Reyranella sp.]MBR2818214.1 hypothetical protein [Reyranella sp.]
MKNKKFDPLSTDVFAKGEAGLKDIDGHGSGYAVDMHAVAPPKTPKVPGKPLSPGRQASVKKAAAASAAKRTANASPLRNAFGSKRGGMR